jgi:hypothetical protein
MAALLSDGRRMRHFLVAAVFLAGCCMPPLPGGPSPQPTVPIPVTLPGSPPASSPTLPAALRSGLADLGCRSTRRLEERAAAREVPQIEDAYELFGELTAVAIDPAVGGVLVCDLRLPGSSSRRVLLRLNAAAPRWTRLN